VPSWPRLLELDREGGNGDRPSRRDRARGRPTPVRHRRRRRRRTPRHKPVDRRGEFVVLLGPSGSGKTTLLNIVGGIDTATDGTVRVAGTNLGGLDGDTMAEFRRTSVGFVFQFFNLIPTLTARENVALIAELGGRADRRADLLRAVGLATGSSTSRRGCPAVSSSASPWRGCWPRTRRVAVRRTDGGAGSRHRPVGARLAATGQPRRTPHRRGRHPQPK
jgi:ABC-type glutathione transport system ATPase component